MIQIWRKQLATQWGIAENCSAGALLARTNSLAHLAILHDPDVFTPSGMQPLGRAMIECAISFYLSPRQPDAGGTDDDLFGNSRRIEGSAELKRMLPDAIPNLSAKHQSFVQPFPADLSAQSQ
ncbi:MAG: hypothetical protein ABJ327_25445 [Litoreibacter sp.]